MSLLIVFRTEARLEFDQSFDWYEQQKVGLGIEFLTSVTTRLEQIKLMPKSCPIVFEDVRIAVVQKFPYSVLYQIEIDRIVVLAVFHSKRNPKIWQERV